MSTSFIDTETLLPMQPWQRNVKLWVRWQDFPDDYVTSTEKAESLGVSFAEFGDDVSELSIETIDAAAGGGGTYAFYFLLGTMPYPLGGDATGAQNSEHFTLSPVSTGKEELSNWLFWLQHTEDLNPVEPVFLYGLARVACRMFQLQVARELLIVFGLVNTPKGGD